MRAIIVLCLVVYAVAETPGYDYQQPTLLQANEGVSHQAVITTAPGIQSGEAVLSQPIIEASNIQPNGLQGSLQPQLAPLIEEFQKEFYSYAAPEDHFDDADADQHISSALKKNLRVLFIRTPENKGLERAALSLAQQASDDRTAIYVLSKQADVANLAKQLQAIKSESRHKPEVHFVKYRTPEDAANAQLAIQKQYNDLPGTSRTSNEGTAPVLNFASRTPSAPVAARPAIASPTSSYLPANVLPTQDYLPPSLRRYRVK